MATERWLASALDYIPRWLALQIRAVFSIR
jgi:hypothetical protein